VSALARLRYRLVKDALLPAALALKRGGKKSRPPDPLFGPPLKSTSDLRRIMARHYALASHAKGAMPVAWVTSGAPVELLRAFGFYTVYPENHSALCGARKLGPEISAEAEARGYSQDLCSYARIDLGTAFDGGKDSPTFGLPRPHLLVSNNNNCSLLVKWFDVYRREWGTPHITLDVPFAYGPQRPKDLEYIVRQFRDLISAIEKMSGQPFDINRVREAVGHTREANRQWKRFLATAARRPSPITAFDSFVQMAPFLTDRGSPGLAEHYQIGRAHV